MLTPDSIEMPTAEQHVKCYLLDFISVCCLRRQLPI